MADPVDAWDDQDFEPEIPQKKVITDKWEGEDEEEDIKDNWDDEDEEKADAQPEQTKAIEVKKKKSLKDRIAEKEEKRKREIEEKRRKDEELKAAMKPMTPAERAAEKQRLQREQEEADLVIAMEAFGSQPSNNDLAKPSLDQMNPVTRDDFDNFAAALKEKISGYEKSPHYVPFLDTLFRDIAISLEPEDLKKLGSTLNALSNEKTKQQKTKGKKKSKKATITMERSNDIVNDYNDDVGDEFEDFI